MNDEHQLSIGYTYYIKGTETNVSPTVVNVTLDRFDSNIYLSNYLDNYGTYKYTFNVDDSNFNGFSTSVKFDIYIAKLTTSKSLDHDTNGGTAYTSLDDAIEDSQNMTSESYIYVYGDALIGERYDELTLGANTELYLPHNASVTEWLDYNPSTGESNAALDVNNVQISSTITKYITITVLEGTQLTVNGALIIGADRGQNGTSVQGDIRSSYSEVILEDTVQVIVNGSIWCYGYIRGTGEIIANSGANIYEPFVITDWRGGTNAGGAYGGTGGGNDELNNIVPFNQYDMHNIEVKTTIKSGANLIGLAAIYTSYTTGTFAGMDFRINAQWNTTNYQIIGDNGILQMTSVNSYIVKDYDSYSSKTTFELNGNIRDNPGQLNVSVPAEIKALIWVSYNLDFEIKTTNLFFGISHNVKIVVKDNAVFNIKYKYKMLPGSELIVEENATLNISGKLIIYKDWKDLNGGSQTYPTTYENAKFVVNGKLIVTVKGYIAGVILSNCVNATIDLTAANLEITSNEGIYKGGISDLMGSGAKITITSTQHLFAYNADAENIVISSGSAPSELDSYKLTNAIYTYDGTKWSI